MKLLFNLNQTLNRKLMYNHEERYIYVRVWLKKYQYFYNSYTLITRNEGDSWNKCKTLL